MKISVWTFVASGIHNQHHQWLDMLQRGGVYAFGQEGRLTDLLRTWLQNCLCGTQCLVSSVRCRRHWAYIGQSTSLFPMFSCVCGWGGGWWCLNVCLPVWRSEINFGCSLFFETGSLTEHRSHHLLFCVVWLVNRLPGSTSLCAGVIGAPTTLGFYMVSKFQSSGLYTRY